MASRISNQRNSKRVENLSATIIHQMQKLNRRFTVACSQIVVLNNSIDETAVRHKRAADDNCKSYRYMLRLKLVTLEGVRDQYHRYAVRMADVLQQLQYKLYTECGLVWSPSRSLEMMDDSD